MRSLVLSSLVLALGSCTLVEGYPAATVEDTAALCHDGLDDDFDGVADCMDPHCRPFCGEATPALCRNGIDDDRSGAADCADPTCVGLCAEETIAACSDGVDQDADGLVDLDDPSCWPEATTTFTRCVEERGGAWTATFRGAADGWLAFGGDARYVPDPTGRYADDVLALPPPVPSGMASGVRNATTVTGSIDDMRMTASVFLPPAPGEIIVRLETPTTPAPGAPSAISIALDGSTLGATYLVDGVARDTAIDAPRASGWYDLSLQMSTTNMSVRAVAADGGSPTTLEVPLRVPLAANAPLRFSISQFGGDGGLLGAAYLWRNDVHPCGDAIIVPPADPARGALSTYLLSAVSDGPSLCVLGETGPGVFQAFRSDDGGRSFGSGASVSLGGPMIGAYCASLAWDPERSSFAGIAWAFGSDRQVTATLLTSPDCTTWQTVDAPALALESLRCATYSVVPSRDGTSPATHELWQLRSAGRGILLLERFWSAAPLSPELAPNSDAIQRVATAQDVTYALLTAPSVHAFSGDLVVPVRVDSTTHVLVVDRDVAVAREWTSFEPSRIDGACDATTLQLPRLYFGTPAHGGLAHSCADDTASGGPTVVRTFAIAASTP